jgi:hypothetical protein
MTKIMHLDECEPENHPEWEEIEFRDGLEREAQMCPQTQYMAEELYADEHVWLEEQR